MEAPWFQRDRRADAGCSALAPTSRLFSVVNNVILRAPPLPESERIVMIGNALPEGRRVQSRRWSACPTISIAFEEMTVFEEQALYSNASVNIDQNGAPTRIRALNVTPSFFRVLRVQPLLGRTFTEDEGEQGNNQKIVLSYGLWQSAVGGDAAIVGREIRLDGNTYTVVGVMPQDFIYLRNDVMLWRALAFTPFQKSDDADTATISSRSRRLKPGATIWRAQEEIDALNAANLDQLSAVQADRDQCRLPHDRPASAGPDRARCQSHVCM